MSAASRQSPFLFMVAHAAELSRSAAPKSLTDLPASHGRCCPLTSGWRRVDVWLRCASLRRGRGRGGGDTPAPRRPGPAWTHPGVEGTANPPPPPPASPPSSSRLVCSFITFTPSFVICVFLIRRENSRIYNIVAAAASES